MDKIEKRIARCLCLQILYANNTSGNTFDDIYINFFKNKNIDFKG